MATLEIMADSSSANHTVFVSTDVADLASHMGHCANARSRFFVLHSALHSAHGLVFSRIVTITAILVICGGLLALA